MESEQGDRNGICHFYLYAATPGSTIIHEFMSQCYGRTKLIDIGKGQKGPRNAKKGKVKYGCLV